MLPSHQPSTEALFIALLLTCHMNLNPDPLCSLLEDPAGAHYHLGKTGDKKKGTLLRRWIYYNQKESNRTLKRRN